MTTRDPGVNPLPCRHRLVAVESSANTLLETLDSASGCAIVLKLATNSGIAAPTVVESDADVPLAFGSDAPVAVVSPFYGLYCALTREDDAGKPPGGWHPGQKMSVEESLRAFTTGSAHAGFAEGRLGMIRVGMRADLSVVDLDPFRSSPREVLGARSLATVVEGEIVGGTEAGK